MEKKYVKPTVEVIKVISEQILMVSARQNNMLDTGDEGMDNDLDE